ncbi:hypothetical protein DI273_01700 [Streptomyces violascens]|nr:hypothetical protein DI273_01700 [Streptomyces violascens]
MTGRTVVAEAATGGARGQIEPGTGDAGKVRVPRAAAHAWTVISPPPSPSRCVRPPVPPGPGAGGTRSR